MFRSSAFTLGARQTTPSGQDTAGFRVAGSRWPWISLFLFLLFLEPAAKAVVLWNDPATILARETGIGADILGVYVKRDDSANETLYIKFHVNPISDKDTENYFAGFELFEGEVERLGIGNAFKAWAYSAFFHADETAEPGDTASYIDLRTLKSEMAAGGATASYQYPRHGVGATIVFKIQYIPGEDDLVTVWLNPDLGPGANEAFQSEGLTTRFNANASFDEIRLRHSGGGGGWEFTDLAIATSFSDFVDASSARPTEPTSTAMEGVKSFTFQTWQKEQGLPQGPVRALLQSHNGYMWVAEDETLTRFDGIRFVPFGIQEGIKGSAVTALCEDAQGALWIGSSDGGLLCWENNRLTTFMVKARLAANSVTALAEDHDHRIWVGSESGLRLWQNGRGVPLNTENSFEGLRVNALLKDPQGDMWIAVKGAGVFQFANNRFNRLNGDSVESLLKDAHCLLLDDAGRLWVGAGEDFLLCRERDSRWHRYRIPRDQARSRITSLARGADGSVWAGSSSGGLLQFKDGKSLVIPSGSGMAGSLVNSLVTDRDGRLWVATEAGINRMRPKPLFTLGQAEGLGFGTVQGLAEVSPGIVWVGKPSDGLYRWDGKSFNRLSAAGLSPPDSQITSALVTKDGFCWVATTNSLLLYKDPLAAIDEVTPVKLSKPNIISMAEDSKGNLWVGTREGNVLQLHENTWSTLTNFSQPNPVTSLVPEASGAMWLGTEGSGLFKMDSRQGVERVAGLPSQAIRTLYLDAQTSLWIGTGDQGLVRLRDGHATTFTTREGLPENNISQILEDASGRLWLGSGSGIACVSKARLLDLASGNIRAVYPQRFGRTDGMASEECTGGFCPSGLKTQSGLLWFPTLKGVAVINPRAQPDTARIPIILLEEVIIDGLPVPNFHSPGSMPKPGSTGTAAGKPRSLPLRITPGKHRVEFRFTAVNFDAPDSIRFRYRLESLDSDWVEAGSRRTAFYSYLPPGDYRFRVAACNSDGVWSESESGLQLTVLRHFWQTWWFMLIAGAGCLSLLIAAIHFWEKGKLNRRMKRLEQERALERERTRIARDLHDEMGAKLCRISFLSEHARRGTLRPEELQDQITSISNASREVLHSLDEIVWAVNPQNDTLEHVGSYIGQYAQEYFQMTGIQCELDIPTQLPAHPLSSQARHHLFLATHEAITNILKHSDASRAAVSMACRDDVFEITISDNGHGFRHSLIEPHPGSNGTLAGDGLINMRRRLAEISGRCEIESSPKQGTRVRFTIPLTTVTTFP